MQYILTSFLLYVSVIFFVGMILSKKDLFDNFIKGNIKNVKNTENNAQNLMNQVLQQMMNPEENQNNIVQQNLLRIPQGPRNIALEMDQMLEENQNNIVPQNNQLEIDIVPPQPLEVNII